MTNLSENRPTKKNFHLNEIGVMRAILILLIVIGHTFAIYGITGSRTWVLPPKIDNVDFFWWITPFFISFSLQAFVFISGYLMKMQFETKPFNWLTFLRKKVSRLLLPMIIFGFLYWTLIDHKSFDNVYSWLNYFLSGPGHLWFLAMLFACFLAMALCLELKKFHIIGGGKSKTQRFLVISALLFLNVCSLIAPTDFRISLFCQYFIYFVLGYFSYEFRSSLKNVTWHKIVLLCIITFFCIACKLCLIQYIPNHFFLFNHINSLVLGLAGSYLLLLLCMKCPENSYLSKIGTWKGFFGIYIFHQFILKALYYHTDVLTPCNKYFVGLVAFTLTILVSYIIAEIFLKSKLKYLI